MANTYSTGLRHIFEPETNATRFSTITIGALNHQVFTRLWQTIDIKKNNRLQFLIVFSFFFIKLPQYDFSTLFNLNVFYFLPKIEVEILVSRISNYPLFIVYACFKIKQFREIHIYARAIRMVNSWLTLSIPRQLCKPKFPSNLRINTCRRRGPSKRVKYPT